MTALDFYEGPDLESVVLDSLRASGRTVDPLDSDDLAAMDEFHALGRVGTLALAELADVNPGERVLDVGAGIGGPSRALARHFGAEVAALDPTERFCRLARALNERCGLADRVTVVQGDGTTLPFEPRSFDLVWTQAVWQSVEEKASLCAEIHHVLRPGGRFAMLELLRQGSAPLHYPVPWADGPAQSFLVSDQQWRDMLAAAGFEPQRWLTGEQAQSALVDAAAAGRAMAAGVPGVGLELLLPDYEARMAGLARNVEEGRVTLLMAVLEAK
jgi:SAM-dependent methyltransferase